MIVDQILNLIYGTVYGIVFLFSTFGDVSLPATITDGIAALGPYISAVSYILPVPTILTIVAFVVAFDLALLTYRLIRWGYQKIPGIH